MAKKNDVVIIEDSKVTANQLKSYLEQLGYSQTHICSTGKSSIKTIRNLANKKRSFVILLDYVMPDMDASSIFSQILAIKPNARVILETATPKEDEGIENLIRMGIFRYLEKPLRFEKLKQIMDTVELEQDFFEKESSQIEFLKLATYEMQQHLHNNIDFILKSAKQISLNLLVQFLGTSDDSIKNYIKKLEQEKRIVNMGEKKEIACNNCQSVKITQIFYCPSCKSSNFKLGKLIEHYDCGNISEENSFKNDLCPNCHREIKALGVDYRVMPNHYICNNCLEFFPEISTDYLCLKCDHKFKLNDCAWNSSPYYRYVET